MEHLFIIVFCVSLEGKRQVSKMDVSSIHTLSSLLDESRKAEESKATQFQQKPGASTNTVVKRTSASTTNTTEKSVTDSEAKSSTAKTNNIWDEAEVPTEDALYDVRDGRPAPRYEFSYKQSVGTEDTFLGMSDKTPLSSDCTHLVVKIHFPGASMKTLDLDVTKNRIRAESKTHYLFTYLPVNVDDANGKAAFDAKKEVLTVTLPIIPEY